MRARSLRWWLVGSVLLCLAALAPWPVSGSGQGARLAPGPVEISVLSADGGKPLVGVVVRLGGRYAASGLDGKAVLDGVPAGDYRLQVSHTGYDRVERDVTLPAGRRPPLAVRLPATRMVPLSGEIRFQGAEQGLPGVLIQLTPRVVPAAAQGQYLFNADWQGRFEVKEIPVGRYQATLSTPGAHTRTLTLDVRPDMRPVLWELQRVFKPADLTVRVKDALSGRPVPGARVEVGECLPAGLIVQGTSDGTGLAVFRGLKLAQLNWADARNQLSGSRRAVMVMARAAGYQAGVAPVMLGPGSSLEVLLDPMRTVSEQEPNDSFGQAQAIHPGATVNLKIAARGDRDFFRFSLRQPGVLKVELGSAGALETLMRLLDREGKQVREQGAHANQNNVWELEVAPGAYTLQVEEWGNNNASDKVLPLKLGFTPLLDPNEPNDDAPRLAAPNEQIRGLIFPRGDVDRFRLQIERPGWLRVSSPVHPMQRHLLVFDRLGKKVGEVGIHAGRAGHAQMAVKPGWYRVEVWEWGNNDSSREPYLVRMEVMADDGVDDPDPAARPLTARRTLEPGDLAAGTIFPLHDVDTYAITVPSAGRIMVRTVAPIQIHVLVFDARGNKLSEHGQHAGREASHSLNLEGPQTVYLQVWEWGNNDSSPWPYVLTTRWEPCDEMEAMARNDQRPSAVPVPFGETLRGNIQPLHDVDIFQLDVDHPGELVLELAPTPVQLHLLLYDPAGKKVAEHGVHQNQTASLRWPVLKGRYFLEVWEWGNNGQSVAPYNLKVDLDRAQPGERSPLENDPIRRLGPGVAEAFKIELNHDRDRFMFDMTAAGKFSIRSWGPLQQLYRLFDDRTGKKVAEWGVHQAQPGHKVIEAAGPTRYRLELTEWGGNGRSLATGYLMFDPQDRALMGENITAAVDPTDPTRVSFRRQAIKELATAARVLVDANGDGQVDLDLPPGGGKDYRYAREGLYLARVLMEGGAGVRSHEQVWVNATGPMERVGVRLLVQHPGEGQLIEDDQPARAAALSYSGVPVDRVGLAVDGRSLAIDYSAPYEFKVPWRSLGSGDHQITFTAWDKKGQSSTLIRNVKVSDYFDLMPADGAVITGQTVKASWNGASFGPAQVRYRKQGQPQWKTATGENGRRRLVVLRDLEAGALYEFQPLGGGEPGPMRTLTRVKGLAFGQSRYGAHIKRDYDQKVGVSVRNHAEKPMTVKLECGQPPEESRLLVGFVGQGSQGEPFSLQPGEEREFQLGISAQDCRNPVVRFPIRMASDTGYSDQAEVVLNVKIPKVELVWEEVGPLKDRLGKKYRLINKGDTLADLAVGADTPDLLVSPFIGHGLIKAGQRMEFEVSPRLYEGFKKVSGNLQASAVGKQSAQPVELALAAGEQVFAVQLTPGSQPDKEAAPAAPGEISQQDMMTARALAGAYLDPSYVDWSKRGQPTDTDGDGRPDRWSIEDRLENVLWVGDDTDGDGAIDFVHGDVGFDGQFDYSAFKGAGGWEPTNLVETWLEMGFALPWARSAYEKHDADIIFNDQVVGKLRDSIPEGNYTFRVPPSALRFNQAGIPEGNQVSISSKHLRGGHYVVSSDFRVKMRLTGTRVYTAAADRAKAEAKAYAMEGLTAQGPDYSVSSAELTLTGKQEKGAEITVSLPVRNVGATSSRDLAVALMRAAPGGKKPVELSRRYLAVGPLTGTEQVELTWKAAAGNHSLMVVVDPDQKSGDTNHDNNTAIINLSIPGDEAPPTLEILEPSDNQAFNETGVRLRVKATDDSGVARVQFRVDGALAQDLPPAGGDTYGAVAVIQPGSHTLTASVIDGSGNQVEKKVRVKIDAKAPTVRIESPAPGSRIAERTVRVQVFTGPEAQTAAVRVNDGPWIGAEPKNGRAEVTLPLDFGPCRIEAMAAGSSGARGTAEVRVECQAQPNEEQKRREEARLALPSGGGVALPGLGRVDVLSPNAAPLVSSGDRAADQPADHELSLYDNFNDSPPEPTRFAVISVTRERAVSRLGALTLWDPGQTALPYRLMRGAEVVHQGQLNKGACAGGQEQWCQGWDDSLQARLRPGIYKLRMDEARLGRNQASRRNGMVKLFAVAQPGDKPAAPGAGGRAPVAPRPRATAPAVSPGREVFGNLNADACEGASSAAFTITRSQVVSGLATRLRWAPGQASQAYQVLKGSSVLASGTFRKGTCSSNQAEWCRGNDSGLSLRLAPGVYKIKTAQPVICKNPGSRGFGQVAVYSGGPPPGAVATATPSPAATGPTNRPDPGTAPQAGAQPPAAAAGADPNATGVVPHTGARPPAAAPQTGAAGGTPAPGTAAQPQAGTGTAPQAAGTPARPGPGPGAGTAAPAGGNQAGAAPWQPGGGPGVAGPGAGPGAANAGPGATQPAAPNAGPGSGAGAPAPAAPQAGAQPTPAAGGGASPGPGGCGRPFDGERNTAGNAPATDQQPTTLPPVRPDVQLPEPGAADPRPPWRPAGWTPPSRPAGGFIGSRVQNRDWYCTNRPNIKVPFRLPDWLRKMNLTYANRAEYERMVNKFLAAMRARGIDTSRLEKFQELLRKRVGQLEQPGELPGWLESMGFAGPKPTDPAKLKEWREQMQARADAWYLRLLASGDPKLIAEGLKARAQAIGKFDQAMAEAAGAAVTQIEANQTLINDIAEALPVVGEMADIYAVVTGETALSGRQISSLEAVLRIAGVVGPPGLTELAKRSPTTRLVLEGLAEMGQNMGKAGHEMLVAVLAKAKVLGDPGDIRKGLAALGDFMTKERRLFGQSAEDAAARAGKEFASTAEGIAAKNRYMRDYADARDVIDRLRKVDPNVNPKQYQELLMEVQKNKTAQMIMNSDRVTNAFRKQTKQQIERIYQKADDQVAGSMEDLFKGRHSAADLERKASQLGIPPGKGKEFRDQVEQMARRNGVSPDQVKIEAMKITNKRPPKPGEVPRTSFGRDRDVTYVLVAEKNVVIDGKLVKQKVVLGDIDHAISTGPYQQAFWKQSGNGNIPRTASGAPDMSKITRHADEADQAVTSARHLEAYNTGEVQLDDFLDKSKVPPITRVEDLKDTVAYKSEHWFHLADGSKKAGNPVMYARNTAEGMRQATKQYDDLVLSRVKQYGLDMRNVPPNLNASMDVFRQVNAGKMTVEQAEHMLKKIGTNPAKAVKDMSYFLEALEKGPGKGFRRVKAAELVNHMAGSKLKAGSRAWMDQQYGMVNDAFKNGHISSEQFMKLRSQVMDKSVRQLKATNPSGWRQELMSWSQAARNRCLINAAEQAAYQGLQ